MPGTAVMDQWIGAHDEEELMEVDPRNLRSFQCLHRQQPLPLVEDSMKARLLAHECGHGMASVCTETLLLYAPAAFELSERSASRLGKPFSTDHFPGASSEGA